MSEEKKAVVTIAVVGTFCLLLALATYRYHDIVMNGIGVVVMALFVLITFLVGLMAIGGTLAAVAVSLWWGLEWCWKKCRRKGGRA